MFQEQRPGPGPGPGPGSDSGPQDVVPDAPSLSPDPVPLHVLSRLERPLSRRVSEESIRTELCEGPLLDSPPRKPTTPEQPLPSAVSDRAELIERLKRGESPTWVPNHHVRLESLYLQNRTYSPSPPSTPQQQPSASPSLGLLPAPTITPEKPDSNCKPEDNLDDDLADDVPMQDGLAIERPRSALHSGNFTPEESSLFARRRHEGGSRDEDSHFGSASTPWMATSPPRGFSAFDFTKLSADYRRDAFRTSGPSSLSSSVSSSFVYKPPTSPLVQSESNEDIDLTLPLDGIRIAAATARNPRRHTLHFAQSSTYAAVTNHKQPPHRRESTYPYQAHQPRRSLTSTPTFSFAGSLPQTPALFQPRRPSFSSEVSPLQHASLVGSYEESILRGRMSTTPSKPLEFTAQIGVLGLGKCKPSLRCPSHVTLPFSAVFYNYGSTSHGRTKTEDGPSPYVGQIDLENGLPNPEEAQRSKRKLQTRYAAERKVLDDESYMQDDLADLSEGDARKTAKQKRRARSPKAPPGGRYRIPEKGQLQIIIKNQNKTAVKLYLVPYDLAGMEPGMKTFIRQRSYSAGSTIDSIPDRMESETPTRPTLRYLVHLHICCPSKGRFYLYKDIRVVFANRVPDDKEKLRNEITYPEPRFTPYKPARSMHPPLAPNQFHGSGALLAAEQAFRRRSSGFSFAHYQHSQSYDGLDGNTTPLGLLLPSARKRPHHPQLQDGPESSEATDVSTTTPGKQSLVSSSPWMSLSQPDTKMTGLESPATLHFSAARSASNDIGNYDKLTKGDAGYGGNAFTLGSKSSGPGSTESLLSKRLRSLGVQGGGGGGGGSSDEATVASDDTGSGQNKINNWPDASW
ncbi:hypothetical protein B0T24DRAFT_521318 [Lasiosphaeria ovina]|uniref:Atos-like conserved domain-containing protein n=1 Tax=Lasiosphaeria ovina TaxID=92902 RepID=A0AAE0NEK0_9PEZI|nr:hypothetical protein B0T24DRAFT_521318 [Lasiosphaeria ovina]